MKVSSNGVIGIAGAEETKPQGAVTLSVLVTARSSMPNASQVLRQILTLGDESGLHPQGERQCLQRQQTQLFCFLHVPKASP